MATPPSSPPLHVVLDALQAESELSDEQLAALPPLDEVELVPQSDSRLIEHAEPGVFTYHPYKLFIGEHNSNPFYAYLYIKGGRKVYQIELCSVDTATGSHYPPIEANWYGTVNNLAYPFNSFLGVARFVAVVKWYFLLAFRAGEFEVDPRVKMTPSWCSGLQGACNELIAAPCIEEERTAKILERKAVATKRKTAEERTRDQDTAKQAMRFRTTKELASTPETKADTRPRRNSTRTEPTTVADHESDKDQKSRRTRQSADRRTSRLPRAIPTRDSAPGLSHLKPQLEVGTLKESRRQLNPVHQELGYPSPAPYSQDARQSRHRSDQGELALQHEEVRSYDRQPTDLISTHTAMPARDPRRVRKVSANRKSHTIKDGRVRTEERPARRRRSEQATRGLKQSAADGSAEENSDGDYATKMSWKQEEERTTRTGDDDVEDEQSRNAAGKLEQARREEEWMGLYRQKVAVSRRMRDLEDEMTVEDKLDVFDRVRYG